MDKQTVQVQSKPNRFSATDRTLFRTLAVPRRGTLFPEVVGAKRQYPGEPEGAYVAAYLNRLNRKSTEPFLELLEPLRKVERVRQGETVEVFNRRDVTRAYARLKGMIDTRGPARITADGLTIPPASNEGKAALAALLLYQEWRLSRIRQCLHCKEWFYSRFERQRFCGDLKKRCQWNDYHSPEWRKQHREQNRKHQKEYRKRNPGRSHNVHLQTR